MDFKKEDIVKLENLTFNHGTITLNLIGVIKFIDLDALTPYNITVNIGEDTDIPVESKEITHATDREEFLFHLHGSKCLRIELEEDDKNV